MRLGYLDQSARANPRCQVLHAGRRLVHGRQPAEGRGDVDTGRYRYQREVVARFGGAPPARVRPSLSHVYLESLSVVEASDGNEQFN
jgi:hypothetical protein